MNYETIEIETDSGQIIQVDIEIETDSAGCGANEITFRYVSKATWTDTGERLTDLEWEKYKSQIELDD